MGRSPYCFKEGLNRGTWTASEDKILTDYIKLHGEGKWGNLPQRAGLKRCGKGCRLRWLNYLRPDIKRGNISEDEEDLIIRLHRLLGNRWSLIAGRLPGRTDNEIKNYWNTNLSKRVMNQHTTTTSSAATKASTCNQNSPAVRTKAMRCTEVFVGPPPASEDGSPGTEPPRVEEDDNHYMDFDLDFGELSFSKFLESDFVSYGSDGTADEFDLSSDFLGEAWTVE